MDIKKLAIKYKNYLIGGGVLLFFALIFFNNDSGSRDEEYLFLGSDEISTKEVKGAFTESYFVEITGQVKFPGVYELDREYMILELLDLAGGATDIADEEYIHKTLGLSMIIQSQQKIYIPTHRLSTIVSSVSADKISINLGSLKQLMSLVGVGEVTAQSIIDNRPYESLDGLKNVSGIGDVTYDKIVSQITL